MIIRKVRYIAVMVLIGLWSTVQPHVATYHEPSAVHSVRGLDHTVKPSRKNQMSFSLLPYHEHAKQAKNASGDLVPLGDRLGYINMLALLIGDGPSPHATGVKFADGPANTSALHAAYDALKKHTELTDYAADKVYFAPTYVPAQASDAAKYGYGKYRTTIKYQRIGLRGGFDYSFANGMGVSIKSGLAEYSIKPEYTGNPQEDTTTDPHTWFDSSAVSSPAAVTTVIHDNLTSQSRRQAIGKDLGIDFAGRSATGMEDTAVELYWRNGYTMKDKEGDKILTAIPYFALGLTLPTAEKKKASRLFDIALGNDGFYGFSGQAEVSFDFPGMVKAGIGGSVTFFNDDNIGKQFVPTSEYQETLFPWQTTITKRPGALWKVYATLNAPHFIDYLSCFVNYTIVAHESDTITASGTNKTLFKTDQLAELGAYNAQLLHIGFEYEVTPALRFGLALQAVVGGKKVWKTTTTAGSMSFVF